jgi:hypothetical protein
LKEFEKAPDRAPGAGFLYSVLAVTYVLLGREEEAHASAAKCLELDPNITVSGFIKYSKAKNKAFINQIANAMRKAGFPE